MKAIARYRKGAKIREEKVEGDFQDYQLAVAEAQKRALQDDDYALFEVEVGEDEFRRKFKVS